VICRVDNVSYEISFYNYLKYYEIKFNIEKPLKLKGVNNKRYVPQYYVSFVIYTLPCVMLLGAIMWQWGIGFYPGTVYVLGKMLLGP
jgi:hypothetical protein